MTFTYYGNFMPGHPAPYSTEAHFAKSLEALGHKVIRLQENTTSTDEVLAQSLKSDGLIWSHTHTYYPQGSIEMSEVLATLRQKSIPTIAFHLDLFMAIPERWRFYQNHDYFNVQYFFTPDKNLANWFTANRGRGYYLPAGVLHSETQMIDGKKEFDVVFIGSKGYHRSWPYRPTLINWLRQNYGDKFSHFGNDGLRVVRGTELNELLGKTKIVVGDSYSPNYNYPYYWSDRAAEITGRGGFLIHPEIVGLRDNWTEDEIVTYRFQDSKGLKETIDFYLKNDNQREKIRRAGFERTKKDHSYKNRWEQIIRAVYG